MKAKRIGTDMVCLLLILLFVYAAVSKWIDFPRFRVEVGQSPVLTDFSGWVVWVVPSLEILISTLLFLPAGKRLGLYSAFSLMTIFSGYIVLILWFSPFTPCSCGGILQAMSWKQHLVFNISFLVLTALAVIWESARSRETKHLLQ